jgi:hypothetical protein
MAIRHLTILVDDLTGEESDDIATVSFSLEGVDYEIDLTAANANKLRAALSDFIAQARQPKDRSKQSRAGRGVEAAKVRDWAKQNSISVPARGRIPNEIMEQFRLNQA